jgi:hypothetical protein
MSEEKTKFSLEVVNKSMKAVDLIRSFKEVNRKQGYKEVEEVEKQIMQCQEGIQKDLIPSNHDQIKNSLTLQFIHGTSKPSSSVGFYKPAVDEQHIYYNQSSNILEMEKRYEPMLNNFNNQIKLALPLDPKMGQQLLASSSRHNFYEIQNILHNEILLFKQDANAMLKEMQEVKQLLINKMTNLVQTLLPHYFVEIYGSHATGLCLHWSDIDLVVGSKNPDQDKDSGPR